MDETLREDFLQGNLSAWRFRFPNAPEFPVSFSVEEKASSQIIPFDSDSPQGSYPRAIVVFNCLCLSTIYPAYAGNEKTGILFIQPGLQSLYHAFQYSDYRELILSPFIFWITGNNWQKQLEELIRERLLFLLSPGDFLFVNPAGDSPMEETIRRFFCQQFPIAKVEYSKKQFFFLQSVSLQEKIPLRIWLHIEEKSPVYAGLTHSWARAFRKLGAEVFLSDFKMSWRMEEKILSEFMQFSPHLAFFLNGPSQAVLEYLGFSKEWAAAIPCRRITWYVDNPLYLSTYSSDSGHCRQDDIAVMDETYCSLFEPVGAKSLFHLPQACMIEKRGTVREEYRFPIVYVGNIVNPSDYVNSLSLDIRGVVMELIRRRWATPKVSFMALMDELRLSSLVISELSVCAEKMNWEKLGKKLITPELNIDYFLYVVATFYTRWEAVKALLPLGLHVFGPNEWLPLLGDRYRDRHHGLIGYNDLPDCYATAGINLNFHSLQCPTALNSRDFDVPAAGGFLLSDWVEDFEKGYLLDNEHLCVARNPEDFVQKAEYYLSHEEDRRSLAESGHEWVLQRHTFLHRAQFLLKYLFPDECYF